MRTQPIFFLCIVVDEMYIKISGTLSIIFEHFKIEANLTVFVIKGVKHFPFLYIF